MITTGGIMSGKIKLWFWNVNKEVSLKVTKIGGKLLLNAWGHFKNWGTVRVLKRPIGEILNFILVP